MAQQWIHELFHALTCILLGGRVVDSFFSIQGAFITCEHANISIVHLVLRMSGGLGASIVLWYFYKATIGRWFELHPKGKDLRISAGQLHPGRIPTGG